MSSSESGKTQSSRHLYRTLFRISYEILASEDLQGTLDAILQAIAEHTPFRRGALTLYDRAIAPDSIAEVSIARTAFVGLSEAEIAAIRADAMAPAERRNIFQERFRVGRSYYIPHELDPWAREAPTATEVSVRRKTWHPDDLLFIPLWLREDELLGMISVDKPADGRAPTPERLEPIETFANLAALAIGKARVIERQRELQRRLQGLYSLSSELARSEDLETLMDHAMALITEHFDYDYGALMLLEGDELVLRGFHSSLPADELRYDRFMRVPIEQGVTGWVARHGRTAWVRDAQHDESFISGHPDIRSELAVPIVSEGTTLGVLNIETTTVDGFSEIDRDLLESLASQLAVVIQSVRRRQELQTMAIHDPLTDAYNRHFFAELMERERARSERTGRPISLVLLDLDDFHRVNQHFGHLTGDAVLVEVAKLLAASVREMDAVIRYGGDEFLVVMPEADETAVERARRRIEARMSERGFPHGVVVRASLGTATWHPDEGRSLDEVLDEADRWMYRRKARSD